MAAIFPASLPWFTRFVLTPAGQRAATQPPMHYAARSNTTSAWARAEVSWVFFESDRAAFEDWFRDDLNRGASWALMKLPITPGGIAGDCYSAVRFPSGYSKTLAVNGLWRVSAQIVIRDRFECVLASPCFTEDFATGLGPYTSPSGGGLARFEIASSPYGSALRYIGGTSATDLNIARDVPSILFETFTAKFLVETASTDNSAYLQIYLDATTRIYLVPRLEAFEDAAQRMRLTIGSGSTTLGASALALNVWHQLTADCAGAYELKRLDTDAVVASGSLATGYASAPEVNSLYFIEDSNLGSTATMFTDIEICPP